MTPEEIVHLRYCVENRLRVVWMPNPTTAHRVLKVWLPADGVLFGGNGEPKTPVAVLPEGNYVELDKTSAKNFFLVTYLFD